MHVFRIKYALEASVAALLSSLAVQGATANADIAAQQGRIGCESYAEAMLDVADGWRFESEGQTFDLRQQNTGEELGIEMFQEMFNAVNHQGLRRFLNETIKYLWEDEERARRFITSGRFMKECVPANTELMKRELQPSDQTQIRSRLNQIQQGVAQGRSPASPQRMPAPRQAPRQSAQESTRSTTRDTNAYRNTGDQQNSWRSQSDQQQQPDPSGLGSRR